MGKTKRIFLSDIHLSTQELYEHPKGLSWFKPKEHKPRVLNFLKSYVFKNADWIKDLVLLGDIFNTWLCPAKMPPPTYSKIFEDNGAILSALRQLIKAGITVFYINGNHDFDLAPSTIQQAIPGIRPIRFYRTSRLHAEHGHRFDIYNKPDYVTDPAYGRPIGYYITRLVASFADEGLGILDLAGYLDDLLEAALPHQNIFMSIIEGLAERAGMGEKDHIRMPGGKKISIAQLKERYGRLGQAYSLTELISDLYHRRYLHGPADRLCKKHDFNIVIFGHTHNALLDKDFFLVEDRIYANTGSWCKNKAYFVEVEKSNGLSPALSVTLYQVDPQGSPTPIYQEHV